MTNVARIRTALFFCGVAAVVLSISIGIACFPQTSKTTDYLKQADEVAPWLRWGFGSAAAGFFLCLFGRKWRRIAGLSLGLVLSIWWFLIAGSLY